MTNVTVAPFEDGLDYSGEMKSRWGVWIMWASVACVVGCSERSTEEKAPTSGPVAPCDASAAQQRAEWVTRPSTNWSGDPENLESNFDSGLRIAGACNTSLKFRAFKCDPTSVRGNVHGFSFFIAERLGFTTVICDEIDGVYTSKRLVEYPIGSAYEHGDFTTFVEEGVRDYSEYMCKCSSKSCATAVRAAYDALAELVPLLPQDNPSQEDEAKIEAFRKRYLQCETRKLGKVRVSR